METEELKKDEKKNVLDSIKKVFAKKKDELTAERAWLESTYGIGANLTAEERISSKQRSIAHTIKSRFRCLTTDGNYRSSYSSYHCVIDIEEDLVAYKDIIFEPFVKNGFRIIDLSSQVNEIEDENVYLISWKHVFRSK